MPVFTHNHMGKEYLPPLLYRARTADCECVNYRFERDFFATAFFGAGAFSPLRAVSTVLTARTASPVSFAISSPVRFLRRDVA